MIFLTEAARVDSFENTTAIFGGVGHLSCNVELPSKDFSSKDYLNASMKFYVFNQTRDSWMAIQISNTHMKYSLSNLTEELGFVHQTLIVHNVSWLDDSSMYKCELDSPCILFTNRIDRSRTATLDVQCKKLFAFYLITDSSIFKTFFSS